MHGKLSRLRDLPHSIDDEKVSNPRDTVTLRYQLFMRFTMLRLEAQILFLPQKAVSVEEPQILIFTGVHCHPKEGGMIYGFSERRHHCSECKWAEELNRWLQ